MKAHCTLERLQSLIDKPISELRGSLSLVKNTKTAYGRLTKGELVVECLRENYGATDTEA